MDIAQKKAWTSRAFDIETGTLGSLSQSGDQFFGINTSNDGKVMIFAGGVPIKQDGKVIGAIGVFRRTRRARPSRWPKQGAAAF